jgi:hypothetical protein
MGDARFYDHPMTAITRDDGNLQQKWVFSSNTRHNYFPLI